MCSTSSLRSDAITGRDNLMKSHSLSTIKRRSNCAAENMGRAPLAAALIGYFNWKTWSHLLFCVPLFKLCIHIYTLTLHSRVTKTAWKCEYEDEKKLRLDSTQDDESFSFVSWLASCADTHVFWPIAKAVVCISIWGNRSGERTRFHQHWEWTLYGEKKSRTWAMSYIIAVKWHVNWAECRNVLWIFQCSLKL